MLTPLVSSVQLRNFRGFRDHTVSLGSGNVLVGHNNAGKSTFIDALRLLAVALSRAKTTLYQPVPDWLDGEAYGMGFRVSFDTVDFDFRNVTTNLQADAPARLQVVYSNRVRLTLWIGNEPGENFAQLSSPGGGVCRSKAEASMLATCPIIIMPPLGSLNPREVVISKARISEFMYGRLSSWHFRNQLYEMAPQYRAWTGLLEETWLGVQVKSLSSGQGDSGKEFSLILREGPFASEAAWVGSGLQAWMQILWFICRADKNACVVLDEPDVFLHADMQRKVAKLVLGGAFHQATIATHSSEIISDVEPSSITVIRKRERSSWKPSRKGELQTVVDQLGSRHNLQLSKLASARRVALFEGEDHKFLMEAALKESSDAYYRLSEIPSFELNGIDNWQQAIGAAKALHASADGHIPVILLMDRDYRSDIEIEERVKDCQKHHLQVHCWSKKEIENFLVNPAVLHRLVQRKRTSFSVEEAQIVIDECADGLQDYTIGAIADSWQQSNRRDSPSTSYFEAQGVFKKLRENRPLRDIVSGKRLIADLSKVCKARYNVSFGAMTLCRATKIEEFPPEFADVLQMLLGKNVRAKMNS